MKQRVITNTYLFRTVHTPQYKKHWWSVWTHYHNFHCNINQMFVSPHQAVEFLSSEEGLNPTPATNIFFEREQIQ